MNTYEEFSNKIEELEQSVQIYSKICEEVKQLTVSKKETEQLKNELAEKYHSKYGTVDKMEAKEYTKQEIDQLRNELEDSSFLTMIKRIFNLKRKKDVIYPELMGMLNGKLKYFDTILSDKDVQKKQQHDCVLNLGRTIEVAYEEVLRESGSDNEQVWNQFVQKSEVGSLYLGDIDQLISIEFCQEDLEKVMPKSLQGEFIHLPYTYSVDNPHSYAYSYTSDADKIKAINSVRALLYQILAQSPEHYVQLHLIDGEKNSEAYRDLLDLRRVVQSNLSDLNRRTTNGAKYKMLQTYLLSKDISEGMSSFDEYLANVTEEMGNTPTLSAYNQNEKDKQIVKGIIPNQILVIQNFPEGFSSHDIELLDKIIKNSNKRGISVILMYKKEKKAELQKMISKDSWMKLNLINLEGTISNFSGVDLASVISLNQFEIGYPQYVQSIINEKMARKEVDNLFEHNFNLEQPLGQMNADEGINIPFALNQKGDLINFTLGNALNAHGLISGGTGSGKSTLLHMLISSVIMNYSPEDVEIWLADFKLVEFNSYKTNTPPHIKFVGLSKWSDFSYAFLDKIYTELERRQYLIKKADEEIKAQGGGTNITSIGDYRKHFGSKSMSRLLIIIDEFHVMSQHAVAETDYKLKLENILAEGRALGIIMLFSDQAIVDGLNGLSDKSRKQIKARLALANELDELKETLRESDMDKIRPFRNMTVGEVAIQTVENERDNDGEIFQQTRIERAKTIFISGEWRFKVSEKVRNFYDAQNYTPEYMDENEVPTVDWGNVSQWERANFKTYRDGSHDLAVYLGKPLNLEPCLPIKILPRVGNNLMCVGGMIDKQFRVLKSLIESFSMQEEYKIVIMTDWYASIYREYSEELKSLTKNPRISLYDKTGDICYQVNKLLADLSNRGRKEKILTIWISLDQIFGELKRGNLKKPRALEEAFESKKIKKEEVKEKESIFAGLESAFADFGIDFDLSDDEDIEDEDSEEISEEDKFFYDAREEIRQIVEDGPGKSIYNVVFYDTALSLRLNREIKSDYFVHKVAFPMSKDECADFLGRANLLDGLKQDGELAVYYDGRTASKFIIYQ